MIEKPSGKTVNLVYFPLICRLSHLNGADWAKLAEKLEGKKFRYLKNYTLQ